MIENLEWMTKSKKGLSQQQIEKIRQIYEQTNSIKKTSLMTNHSKNTVNKYVKDLSKNKNKAVTIYSLDINGNIKKWRSVNMAAKQLKTSPSNILKCLQGKTTTACNMQWSYSQEIKKISHNDFSNYWLMKSLGMDK